MAKCNYYIEQITKQIETVNRRRDTDPGWILQGGRLTPFLFNLLLDRIDEVFGPKINIEQDKGRQC